MSDIQEQIKLAHKRAEENDIKLLQEENKKLKIEYQRLANDDAWEIADYKLRNEKAIEYIKNNFTNKDGEVWHSDIKKIYVLLNGVDEE